MPKRQETSLYQGVGRWWIVGILAILYALSFLDRVILALLAQPVSRDLGLDDSQMALLLGVGFAALYALMGIPAAWLIDRGRRTFIVAGGVALWSLSTILSGFAHDFSSLLVLRAGVAIGEAVLTPAAVSLIADLFDRDRRALPTSVYMSIGGFMTAGAFIAGAWALDLATHLSSAFVLAPWRLTLVLVGLPGLLLAAVVLIAIREPQRLIAGDLSTDRSVRPAAIPYLARHLRFYLPFLLGLGCTGTVGYAAVSWGATMMVRGLEIGASEAGYLFGLVGVPASLAGMYLWPWLGSRGDGADRVARMVGVMSVCAVLAVAGALLLALSDSRSVMLVTIALTMGTMPTATVLASLVVQHQVPGPLRARMMAICLIFISLVGYSLGSLAVAAVAGHFPEASGLRMGLAAVGLVGGTGAIIAFLIAARGVSSAKPD